MTWLASLTRSIADAVGSTPEASQDIPESLDPRDRRTAPRHEAEVSARLRMPASEHDCTIIDLSTGGMNVVAPDAAVSVGQQVAVFADNFPLLAGVVRWVRNGMFGVQFARPIAPELIEGIGKNRRRVKVPRAARAHVELPIKLYFDGTRHDVVTGNISVGGVMLTMTLPEGKRPRKPIRKGQALMIEFPDQLPIGGHVRWVSGDQCGIMFSKLLAVPIAEEIQRLGNLSPAWIEDVRQVHIDMTAS